MESNSFWWSEGSCRQVCSHTHTHAHTPVYLYFALAVTFGHCSVCGRSTASPCCACIIVLCWYCVHGGLFVLWPMSPEDDNSPHLQHILIFHTLSSVHLPLIHVVNTWGQRSGLSYVNLAQYLTHGSTLCWMDICLLWWVFVYSCQGQAQPGLITACTTKLLCNTEQIKL